LLKWDKYNEISTSQRALLKKDWTSSKQVRLCCAQMLGGAILEDGLQILFVNTVFPVIKTLNRHIINKWIQVDDVYDICEWSFIRQCDVLSFYLKRLKFKQLHTWKSKILVTKRTQHGVDIVPSWSCRHGIRINILNVEVICYFHFGIVIFVVQTILQIIYNGIVIRISLHALDFS
jgi:hypothetical protein